MSKQISGGIRPFLSFLKKAIVNPEKSPSDTRLWIRLLSRPGIYDVYALIVQLFDRRRIMSLPMPADDDMSDAAKSIRHNLKEIRDKYVTTSRRVEMAYQIATTPWRDVSNEKILIIGCRNIMELHQARIAGFSWKNIRGADLFSTNEKILTMNMEDMTDLEDSSLDVVTMVNTLSYSSRPDQVFSEVLRVLRPGGRFVFNYARILDNQKIVSRFSGEEFVEAHFESGQEHVTRLCKLGAQMYFHTETVKNNVAGVAQATHWFGFEKKAECADPVTSLG